MEILDRYRLDAVRGDPRIQAKLVGSKICIYTRQTMMWWRSHSWGYTGLFSDAGVYDFEDAFRRVAHLPSNGLEFIVVQRAKKSRQVAVQTHGEINGKRQ